MTDVMLKLKLAVAASKAKLGTSNGQSVIATTADGGRVMKSADGSLTFASPAYSTNDQAKIAEIMKGATPAQVSTSGFDQSTIAQHPIASRAAVALSGVPFAGTWADEAVGAVSPAAGDAMRASQSAMGREHPYESAALQTAGAVAGAVPMAIASGPAITAAAPSTLPGQIAGGVIAGGTTGAIEGAVSGAGRGMPGDRTGAAMRGAAIGAGMGAAVGGVAPIASRLGRAAWEWVRKTDVRAIADRFKISPEAAQLLKQDIAALDPTEAAKNLQTAGPNAILADAGGPTRELLDAAIAGGGKASQIGNDAVYTRSAEAGSRLDNVMNALLGKPKGLQSVAKDISTKTAPARKAAYDLAYRTPIDYASPKGQAIEEVLTTIEPKLLNTAISRANAIMRAGREKNQQIMAILSPDGQSVVFKEMPNVQQLDQIKRALGDIGAEVDNFGRPTFDAKLAGEKAGELRDALVASVPAYERAAKLGGDKIAEDRALNMGRSIFDGSVTREAVTKQMKDAGIDAQAAAKQGIREKIDEVLARVRRNPDNTEVDTAETARLLAMLSNRDARDKITIVLGPQKAKLLFSELDAAGKQFGTMRAIATGSQTARRTMRNETATELSQRGPWAGAVDPNPFSSTREVIKMMIGNTPNAAKERKLAMLSDVARALTTMRGPEAEKALSFVQAAIAGQPVKASEAARVSRTIGNAVGILGYQEGSRQIRQKTGAQ